MGGVNQCECKPDNSSDDFLYSIFDTMKLKKLDVNIAYKEFTSCIITTTETHQKELKYSNKSDIPKFTSYHSKNPNQKLNEKLFPNFLLKIVSDRENQPAQLSFFSAVFYISGNDSDAIKRLGAFIILNSNGSYIDKLSLLQEHIFKYYGRKERRIKEFVNDIVIMNTEICLIAFEKYFDKEMYDTLQLIWRKHRLEKYVDSLFSQYEQKYFNSIRPSYFKNICEEKKDGSSTLNSCNIRITPGETVSDSNYEYINRNNKLNRANCNGNNTDMFNKYSSYFMFELQGHNIRNNLHSIYLMETNSSLNNYTPA